MVTERSDWSVETGVGVQSPFNAVLAMFEEIGVVLPEVDKAWNKYLDGGQGIHINRHCIFNPETGKFDVDSFHIMAFGVDFTIAPGGLAELKISSLAVEVRDKGIGVFTDAELVLGVNNPHPLVRDLITQRTGSVLVDWVKEMAISGKYQECPLKITFGPHMIL